MIEDTRLIYQGRVIKLNLERVRLPNQRVADLEIIHHPGGAAIVAIDAEQRICLLHQFRHAVNGWLWELPAGKIDHHEPHLQTAQRELREEAGCVAGQWHYLGHCVSSPGVFTEVVHLYLATELTMVGTQPEADEVFQIEWRTLPEIMAMIQRDEIVDGKTLAAILKSQVYFQARREV